MFSQIGPDGLIPHIMKVIIGSPETQDMYHRQKQYLGKIKGTMSSRSTGHEIGVLVLD